MPRIYAPVATHKNDWAGVPFLEGAAAVPAGTDVSRFTADEYTIDNSKHKLELWDKMNSADLATLCAYLGVTAQSTRTGTIRAIESMLSTARITALTLASAAGTATGDTALTATTEAEGDFYAKTGASAAPTVYYGDQLDSTWKKLTGATTGAQYTLTAAHTKVGVACVAGGVVIAYGTTDLVVKT